MKAIKWGGNQFTKAQNVPDDLSPEQFFLVKALWAVVKKRESERRQYRKNPQPYLDRAHRLHAADPEKHRQRTKEWVAANPERKEQHDRDSLYGKGAHAHFQAQIAEQDNLCAICERPMTKPGLDHDHTTGQWRGALCSPCNAALGGFGDSILRLNNAVAYLLKWRKS